MKEFKGTQGPWKIQNTSIANRPQIYSGSNCIADLWDMNAGFPSKDEALANAYLISAAPDLLQALQDILIQIENSEYWWIDCPDKGGFDVNEIKSAISKALTF